MVKPITRQQVFCLTTEELEQVDEQVQYLNKRLTPPKEGPSCRQSTYIHALSERVSDRVLYEVASRFLLEGYRVDATSADRLMPPTIRIW